MEKKLIVKFINEKNRNVYDAIIDEYSNIILGWRVNLLKRVIEIDLERNTGEEIKLNYFSLCKAVKKFKKRKPSFNKKESIISPKAKPGYEFKDAHELNDKENNAPGSFTLS